MFAESLVTLFGALSIHAAQAQTAPGVILNSLPVAKYVTVRPTAPQKKNLDSLGVVTSAKAAMVMDVKSGEILYQKDAETAYPIASLTKLVTAMTILDQKTDLNQVVEILKEDEGSDGKIVFLTGERLLKRDLLRALLVESVNTAGNVLARTSGDKETFVKAMNAKAKALHMDNTFFGDPTGLDPHNQASAHDVALALRAALSYPEIRDITKLESLDIKGRATGRKYHLSSTNLLLESFLNKGNYQIIAGKTGSLPEAGFCFSQATRNKEGNEVIAVVLGSENHFMRFQDVKALTYWTFQNYAWPKRQN